MIKKGFVIGIVIVFLVGSIASGITINITDSIEQTEQKNPQHLGDRGSGLVAHWDFDEGSGDVLHDVSGNGNDGTIYGATWTSGFSDNALKFDGDNDYVLVPSSTDFQLYSWTICGWINITNFSSTGSGVIGKNQHTSPGGKYNFYIQLFADQTLVSSYEICDNENDHRVYSNPLNESEYIFFTSTRNHSSGDHIIYINGKQEDIGNWLDTPCANDEDLFIGRIWESDTFFNGTIDEVCIYNRALSEDEIQYLYENPGTGDIVYVDDDYNSSTPGWQIDHFNRIQDGIDAVDINGTVYVYNGTYYENVDISKDGINLIGEDKNMTIIDGSGGINTDILINIENQNYITVNGFTIRNAETSHSQGTGM
jgi:hypothetical protein